MFYWYLYGAQYIIIALGVLMVVGTIFLIWLSNKQKAEDLKARTINITLNGKEVTVVNPVSREKLLEAAGKQNTGANIDYEIKGILGDNKTFAFTFLAGSKVTVALPEDQG